jgi:hypothetical protein
MLPPKTLPLYQQLSAELPQDYYTTSKVRGGNVGLAPLSVPIAVRVSQGSGNGFPGLATITSKPDSVISEVCQKPPYMLDSYSVNIIRQIEVLTIPQEWI